MFELQKEMFCFGWFKRPKLGPLALLAADTRIGPYRINWSDIYFLFKTGVVYVHMYVHIYIWESTTLSKSSRVMGPGCRYPQASMWTSTSCNTDMCALLKAALPNKLLPFLLLLYKNDKAVPINHHKILKYFNKLKFRA